MSDILIKTNCQNIMFAVVQHSRFVDIFRRKFEQKTVCKKKKSVDFSKILTNKFGQISLADYTDKRSTKQILSRIRTRFVCSRK